MKFTKNLLLLITIMFVGIFYSKETYSKEKKSKTDYNYVTEKIKIYSDENKKENIGLIEVMGLAVLPGRLKFEMRKIAEYLKDEDFEKKISDDKDTEKHLTWLKAFINKYSIEIIKGENKEFIANLKEKFFGEKKSGDVQQNYA